MALIAFGFTKADVDAMRSIGQSGLGTAVRRSAPLPTLFERPTVIPAQSGRPIRGRTQRCSALETAVRASLVAQFIMVPKMQRSGLGYLGQPIGWKANERQRAALTTPKT
jgi:hypothetical protein